MTLATAAGIATGAFCVIEFGITLCEKLKEKKKEMECKRDNKNFDYDLYKNFEEFKLEAMKTNKNTKDALKMMTRFLEELDDRMGIDPNEIKTEFA